MNLIKIENKYINTERIDFIEEIELGRKTPFEDYYYHTYIYFGGNPSPIEISMTMEEVVNIINEGKENK